MDLDTYTERCTSKFLNDIKKLNIKQEEVYPRASENVEAMVNLVEKLVERGHAYEKLRSVYFDISKIDDYGRLSNIDLKKVKPGKTIESDDYEKDSPVDFTLLKRSSLNELKRGIYFKTRWGNVRPSWHLECAAISIKYLADNFDIHASGTDVIFPHCENVMAIGRAATGKRLANYWINTELVMVDGKKMSRSLNNVKTIEDLETMGYGGRQIRFFLLGTHYRKPLNFSFGALETAKNTVKKLDRFIQRLMRYTAGGGYPDADQLVYDIKQRFSDAMDDDFNISDTMASLFEFVGKVSIPLSLGQLSERERDNVLDVLKRIDDVLGVMNFEEETLSEDALRLLEERERARRIGDWKASDEIRKKLLGMGIEISDSAHGVTWRLK
jgi:cysteinyl-tRNA synthetase